MMRHKPRGACETWRRVRAQLTYGKSAVGTGDATDGAAVNVKFCLAFQREALSVPVMRRVLGDILRTLGVDGDNVTDILLAATEACSNVLRHGRPRATGYAVLVTIGAHRCEVEVAEDWSGLGAGVRGEGTHHARMGGRRLDRADEPTGTGRRRRPRHGPRRLAWRRLSPSGGPANGRNDPRRPARELEAHDVAQLSESGRGLDVMRACVDDVTMRSRPGRGTVVTMRKHIDWASDAPLTHMRAAS
jgi:anti-sigma regulatory factor (Ser/Thr protein kinase)